MNGRRRRLRIALLAVVPAAVAALTGCAGSDSGGSSGDASTITIAQSTQSMSIAPLVIADQQGFFKAEGLTVKFVSANGDSVAQSALDSGSAQFLASTAVNHLAAISKGRPFKEVSSLAYPLYGYVLTKAKAEQLGFTDSMSIAERVKLFDNVKIGVASVGGASDLIIRQLMRENGLDPAKQKITAVGTTAVFGAIKSGAVDGGFLGEPDLSQAIATGVAVPVIPANTVPWLNKVPNISLATTTDYAEKNPETVRKVTNALQKAFDVIHSGPAQAEAATKAYYSKIDPAVFTKMWQQNTEFFPTTAGLTEQEFNGIIKQNSLVGSGKELNVSYADAVVAASS